MVRKGFVHTLEATLITIIILTFILGVVPAIEKRENISSSKEGFAEALSSLDKRNLLRPAMYSSPIQLATIKANLSTIVTKRINFTVGVTTVTNAEQSVSVSQAVAGGFEGNYTFSVDNSTVESAFVILTFTTADNADFFFNDQLVAIRDTTSNVSTVDLSDRYVNGVNVFEIVMPSQQTVSLTHTSFQTERLDPVPEDQSINIVSMFTAGINNTYDPREVRVYLWNE